MNVMREFTKKSLLSNKKRTVVTIIGVILSAAMITAVPTFIASFLSALQRSEIAQNGNWHARIQNVQVQNISVIETNSNIRSVVLAQELGFAPIIGSKGEQKPYLYFRSYDENGYKQMSIRLVSGRFPKTGSEVVISETIQNVAGVPYQIGDTIHVTLGQRQTLAGEAIMDNSGIRYQYDENGNATALDETFIPGKTQTFTVVGVMERPSFENSWSAGCGVLGYVDKAMLAQADKVDVYLTARNIDRGIFQTMPAIAQQIGNTKKDIVYNDHLLRYYGAISGDNLFSFLFTFSAIIIGIIIIASVSLIYNAFAISVSERAKQLGLLSSVGATKRQKRSSMYYEALIIGAIGVPLGILSGIGGIGITLRAIAPLLQGTLNTNGTALTLVVSPLAIAIAVVLSAATIFISVYIPARRASRIMPIDAIRQTGEIKLTRKVVKTSKLTRKLFGFEAEIALKNLKRSRKKYRATIVSLVISLVLFLTVSTYVSMATRLSGATEAGFNYDISVSPLGNDAFAFTKAVEAIATMPHVSKSAQATILTRNTRLSSDALTGLAKQFLSPRQDGQYNLPMVVVALDQKSFLEYANATGLDASAYTDAKNPQAILINHGQEYLYSRADKKYIKQSGEVFSLKPGDTINIYENKQMAQSKPDDEAKGETEDSSIITSIRVGTLTQVRPMGTLIQGFSYATMVMSEDVFHAVFSNVISNAAQHAIYLSTDDDQTLEKQLSALPGAESSLVITNVHTAARAEQNTSTFLGVFVYGFIILISLICVANIFNTVSTNIVLRRKEFAMLRSVGMTPKSFNRMIRFESAFYGLKGLLYGLPISVLIAYLLYRLQQSVLGSTFSLPLASYAFAILMILAIVFATMLYSTNKIKKENIIDALKEESF